MEVTAMRWVFQSPVRSDRVNNFTTFTTSMYAIHYFAVLDFPIRSSFNICNDVLSFRKVDDCSRSSISISLYFSSLNKSRSSSNSSSFRHSSFLSIAQLVTPKNPLPRSRVQTRYYQLRLRIDRMILLFAKHICGMLKSFVIIAASTRK